MNVHANCCAVDLDDERVRRRRRLFCASTIALTIEIAVTSTAGIAVQTISSWVWPWVGGPSESSSGLDAELPDRVAEHGRDDREDADADRRREPVDEVDAVGLLARRQAAATGSTSATAVAIAAATSAIAAS